MKKLTPRNWIGIAAGAVAGFLYYNFVGCSSGACLISSNVFISVPYGMFMGYLLSDLLKPASKKPQINP
jgi:phage shock protein E